MMCRHSTFNKLPHAHLCYRNRRAVLPGSRRNRIQTNLPISSRRKKAEPTPVFTPSDQSTLLRATNSQPPASYPPPVATTESTFILPPSDPVKRGVSRRQLLVGLTSLTA